GGDAVATVGGEGFQIRSGSRAAGGIKSRDGQKNRRSAVAVGHLSFFFPIKPLSVCFLTRRLYAAFFVRFHLGAAWFTWRLAQIARPKRKLPAGLLSAGGFFSCGFETRRQL